MNSRVPIFAAFHRNWETHAEIPGDHEDPDRRLLTVSTERQELMLESLQTLRAMANEGRLSVLFSLMDGPKSVTELSRSSRRSLSYTSQMLGLLRSQGLVSGRRDGKEVYYSCADENVLRLVSTVYQMFAGRTAH